LGKGERQTAKAIYTKRWVPGAPSLFNPRRAFLISIHPSSIQDPRPKIQDPAFHFHSPYHSFADLLELPRVFLQETWMTSSAPFSTHISIHTVGQEASVKVCTRIPIVHETSLLVFANGKLKKKASTLLLPWDSYWTSYSSNSIWTIRETLSLEMLVLYVKCGP